MSYCAYVHIRPDKPGPAGIFYVGKANERRVKKLHRKHNKHHTAIVKKVGAENIKVHVMECSTEEEAFALEISLIKCLRHMGVELCNQTDGGEGASGYVHSEEARAKLSLAGMGRIATAETRAKMVAASTGHTRNLGRKASPETRAKLSTTSIGNTRNLGHKRTVATKVKLSAIQRAGSLRSANTSGYNGVSWDTRSKKWVSCIYTDGKNARLGRFTNKEDAINARKAGELTYWGTH